ncbi:MAG: transcriptional repressor [Myxococcota bacterium]
MRSNERQDLGEELAGRGLRATRQRIAVLSLLRARKGHPTAAEMHSRLLRKMPDLSKKTVYEILDALVNAGLAGRVTEGGEPARYEGNRNPHYHARCRVCGRLYDVPAKADAQIRGRTPLPEGFQVESIRVSLEGRCLRCADEI